MTDIGGVDAGAGRASPAAVAGRIGIGLVIAVIAAVWAIALFGHFDVPGKLADPAFPAAAQPICQAARDRIATLPIAAATPDHVQRAAVVDRASDEVDRMLRELDAVVPAAEPERTAVREWLADYRLYVENRRDYANRLRDDPTARLYVTKSDRDRSQITVAIDRFANVNAMAACMTPPDVS